MNLTAYDVTAPASAPAAAPAAAGVDSSSRYDSATTVTIVLWNV